MSIFTVLAKALRVGLHGRLPEDEVPAPEDSEVMDAPAHRPDSGASTPYGQFQPIIDAVRDEMTRFARTELAAHRAINTGFHCQITDIEIEPSTDDAARTLNDLVSRHDAKVIADLLKNILGKVPHGPYFDFTVFGGITTSARPTEQPSLDENQALLNEIHWRGNGGGAYRVTLRWKPIDRQPAATPPAAPEQPAPAPAVETVIWRLTDRLGEREVAVARRGAEKPVVLGTFDTADIRVEGQFTSGRHGALWFERGCWWYQDQGTTNGSRVVRPDQPASVFPAEGKNKPLLSPVEIEPGWKIVFSATEEGDPADFPILERPKGDRVKATPPAPGLRRPEAASGPETSQPMSLQPIARLQIKDVLGERKLDLHASQLPFAIGRDETQPCKVPWDHQTVAREHLEIVAIDAQGAHIRMLGGNGGAVAQQRIEKGKDALWPWDASLLLGDPPEGEPEFRLVLLKPATA